MVMLCFVLDLRCLSPALLRDLKQIANFHAISSSASNGNRSKLKPLLDRIGLCYVFKNRITCADELKVAYSPRGNFNLRDFHHAVSSLPTDAFTPEFNNSMALCGGDMKLSGVLNDKVLYSWGSQDKDITRKVVLISSCIVENLDSVTRRALMDAADKCVSVEFVFLEQNSSHLADIPGNINSFLKKIGDLENCLFQHCIPDGRAFFRLVKQWSQELKDDIEEPLQARFIFKINLVGSSNQILCNMSTSFNQIIDEFLPCQLDYNNFFQGIVGLNENKETNTNSSCPVTGNDLGTLNVIENSLKIGESIILYMPSFQCFQDIQQVSSPIDFNVIERTNLQSLNEGGFLKTQNFHIFAKCLHISGTYYKFMNLIIYLLVCVFQVLSGLLNSLDQGLVCSSNFNIETARQTSFLCYYILLPSEKGVMLLRRLAGSEEILPVPDVPFIHMKFVKFDILITCTSSINERAIPLRSKDVATVLNSSYQDSTAEVSPSVQTTDEEMIEGNISLLYSEVGDKTSELIAEEWEQLIVSEDPKICSPSCNSKPKLDLLVLSAPQTSRQLDEKTSRILERLEVPKQLKRKTSSPVTSSSIPVDTCALNKKPLVPFGPVHSVDHGVTSSQPIKPNFQRIRRKK
nr:uncharacterized protein LOC109183057 [Ipomoea batatas]